ncbi:YheC/YheD family endospore coat-associated protein [Salinithrix halophila]
MGYARIVIQIVSERYFPHQTNMIMSQSLASRLNLPRRPVWVTFGSASDPALITLIQNHTPLVRVSSRLAERLKITGQKTLNARYDPSARCLMLGPFLGILMNRDVEGRDTQLFGVMTRFMEECAQAAASRGVYLTVFPPEGIDLSSKTIRGWTWGANRWQSSQSPLPDVVYNRLTSRRLERGTVLQQKLNELKTTHHVDLFNETFLDKQQMYDTLSKNEQIAKMLPDTQPWHISRLKPMVEQYRTVFLKPTNGSLGQGIIRVTLQDGKWICQYSEATGTVTRIFPQYREALRRISRKTAGSRYIIQRGLNLVTLDDRSVDFRVLVQKNATGVWSVTSTVARVANDSHIVSNLARGGTLRKAGEVLASIHTVGIKPDLRTMQNTALTIARTFEELAQGHFAELGIDLVVDKRGHLWLIELNSKPSKTDDTVTRPTLALRPSVVRLIDYVIFCTDWAPYIHIRQPRRPQQKPFRRKPR